jgi:hypothetical protein
MNTIEIILSAVVALVTIAKGIIKIIKYIEKLKKKKAFA